MQNKKITIYQVLTRVCTVLGILGFIALGFCLEVFL